MKILILVLISCFFIISCDDGGASSTSTPALAASQSNIGNGGASEAKSSLESYRQEANARFSAPESMTEAQGNGKIAGLGYFQIVELKESGNLVKPFNAKMRGIGTYTPAAHFESWAGKTMNFEVTWTGHYNGEEWWTNGYQANLDEQRGLQDGVVRTIESEIALRMKMW